MKLLTWIVVANNSSARFFIAERQSSPLTEIETLTHSEGRLHDSDMTSDLKKHESEQFAHQIAHRVEVEFKEHKFKQLILIAAPSFLGLLRNQLSEQLKKRVCLELDNNIVNLTPIEIRAHLPEYLPHLPEYLPRLL